MISFTSDKEFFKGEGRGLSGDAVLPGAHPAYSPKGCQYIRRYYLYASRTKGKWLNLPHVLQLAPLGWKKERLRAHQAVQPCYEESACSISDTESRSTWAKLIAQVHELDPLVCPFVPLQCGFWP